MERIVSLVTLVQNPQWPKCVHNWGQHLCYRVLSGQSMPGSQIRFTSSSFDSFIRPIGVRLHDGPDANYFCNLSMDHNEPHNAGVQQINLGHNELQIPHLLDILADVFDKYCAVFCNTRSSY